jgi:hypothetical protein
MKNYSSAVASLILVGLMFLSPTQLSAAPQLMACWSFDSSLGSTFYDVTGHGYNATATGNVVGLAPGVKGQALSCPGGGYEISAPNSSNDFYVPKYSIECWFYSNIPPSSFSDVMVLFNYQYVQSGVRNGYSLHILPKGNVVFSMSSGDGNTWEVVTSSAVINATTWYQLTCTYDSSYMRIYINSELSGSLAYQGTYVKCPIDIRIGCARRADNSTAVQFVNGKIDELKFYNYALIQDSVSAHYNAIPHAVPVLIPYTPNPTFNLRPLLQWHANPAVSHFRIQIATDTVFSSLIAAPSSTTDTFYLPSADMPIDTIFWRVANEVNPGVDFWSTRSSIIVQDSSVPLLIPYTPDPTYIRRPQLKWHPGKGATAYTIQINTASSFTKPLFADSASDTTYSPVTDLPLGYIYWHVRSKTGTQYSTIDTFLLLSDSVPVLIPVTPDTQRTLRPRLSWYHAAAAPSYLLQIDLAGNFATPYFSTTLPNTDTTYLTKTNLPMGQIFWRVGAIYPTTTLYSYPDTFWILATGIVPKTALGNNRSTFASFVHLRRGITVDYMQEKQGTVSLDIFSIAGNRVVTAYRRNVSVGKHTMVWDGTNKEGRSLPAGSYIAVLKTSNRIFTEKIALTR